MELYGTQDGSYVIDDAKSYEKNLDDKYINYHELDVNDHGTYVSPRSISGDQPGQWAKQEGG